MAKAGLPPARGSAFLFVFAMALLAAVLATSETLFVFLAVLGAAIALLALQMHSHLRLKRAYSADQHADEPYNIEVSEVGIRTWCAHVDVLYPWDGLDRVVRTPEFYLFLRGPGGGAVIPRRVLDPPSERELHGYIRESFLDGSVELNSD